MKELSKVSMCTFIWGYQEGKYEKVPRALEFSTTRSTGTEAKNETKDMSMLEKAVSDIW